jgi:hypothetical protein
MSFGCHYIAKQCQMPVVDIGTVEADDVVHFPLNCFPHCLNAEHFEDLTNVIAVGSHGINIWFAEHLQQGSSVCLQEPFGDSLEASLLSDNHSLFAVFLRFVHVHFSNRFNALKSQITQHVWLNAPEEDIVLHLVHLLLCLLVLVLIAQPQVKHEFVGIVIRVNHMQIVAESLVDLLCHCLHCQFLVRHPFPIELQAKQPGTCVGRIKVRHFVEDLHPFLILFYAGILRVRIIINGCISCNFPQCGMFQFA